jgi:hypothetical protein
MYSPENIFWETNAIIYKELISNLTMACVGVTVIALILLISPLAVIIITLSVLYVDVVLVGEMWLLDIPINTVSVVNLVMAVGLAVDYGTHVMHAFLSTPGTCPAARIKDTMLRIAAAVVLAIFSTLVGVIVLGFSKSHIMRTFFKLLFGTVVVGGLVGLVLLPVVLSLIGPGPCLAEDEEEEEEETGGEAGGVLGLPPDATGQAKHECQLLIPTSELSEIGMAQPGVVRPPGSHRLSSRWGFPHSLTVPSQEPFYSGNRKPDSEGHMSPRRHRYDPMTVSSIQAPMSGQAEGYSRLYQVRLAPPSSLSSRSSHRSSMVYSRKFAWAPGQTHQYTNQMYGLYSQEANVASAAPHDRAAVSAISEEAPASEGTAWLEAGRRLFRWQPLSAGRLHGAPAPGTVPRRSVRDPRNCSDQVASQEASQEALRRAMYRIPTSMQALDVAYSAAHGIPAQQLSDGSYLLPTAQSGHRRRRTRHHGNSLNSSASSALPSQLQRLQSGLRTRLSTQHSEEPPLTNQLPRSHATSLTSGTSGLIGLLSQNTITPRRLSVHEQGILHLSPANSSGMRWSGGWNEHAHTHSVGPRVSSSPVTSQHQATTVDRRPVQRLDPPTPSGVASSSLYRSGIQPKAIGPGT